MPGKLVESLPLGVALSGNDLAVFLPSNGALGLEADRGPLAFGDERPGQPVHIQAEVMQASEVNVGRDASGLYGLQEQIALCLGDDPGQDGAKALSLATVRQRRWLSACFVAVRASKASPQVRVVIPLSVPAR